MSYFLRDRDLVFLDSSLFHTDAAGEVLALCGGLLAAARLDPDRSPYEDKVMRELADDLSEALRSLRGRLMDEEVRRQYFESLLNKVDTAVLVTDREGAIEWKNRAADALLDTRCRLPNEFLEAIKAGKTVVRYGKTSVPQDCDRCHSYRLARLRALDRQLEEHPFYLGAE